MSPFVNRILLPSAAFCLILLSGGPAEPLLARLPNASPPPAQDKAYDEHKSHLPPLEAMNAAYRSVSRTVEPSVVHISVQRKNPHRALANRNDPRKNEKAQPETDEEQLREFFKKFGPGAKEPKAAPNDDTDKFDVPQTVGAGSGWVWIDGRHIITNNHVVEKADDIEVRFFDKSTRRAKVVGTDPLTDIAVLRVEGSPMRPARVAETAVLQGDQVFAFGSPFGFEFSMSRGIVSGTGRSLGAVSNGRGYEDFIQTDAAINQGNSGGPLTNIYGEVVGMNTLISTPSGASAGVGFSIPTDMIRNVATQIIETGKVSRGFLGVIMHKDDLRMLRSFGYEGQGVMIDGFSDSNSPAAKAGLKQGDIITHINGREFGSSASLRRFVAGFKPSTELAVKVFRRQRMADDKTKFENKTLELKVTLAKLPVEIAGEDKKMPELPDLPDLPGDDDKTSPLRKLGIETAIDFTSEAAKKTGLKHVPGVLIERVRLGSAAAAERITRNGVITQVMDTPVASVKELNAELAKHDLKKGVRLTLSLDGTMVLTFIALPE